MRGPELERLSGIAGLVGVAIGAGAVVFERGVSRGAGPAATIRHFQEYGDVIRLQSLLFVVGAGFFLWFLVGLRSRLRAAEGGDGSLADLVLVAGALSGALTLVALAVQVALTLEAPLAALAALNDVLFVVSGLPLAVALVAVAVISFRHHAFAHWVGWLSAVTAVTQTIPVLGIAARSGALAPGGWLSAFLPFPLYMVWLTTTAVVLTVGAQKVPAPDRPSATVLATPTARSGGSVGGGS